MDTTINTENIEWVGAFGSWKGIPALPVALPEYQELQKTFQTTLKITEKKPTKNQNYVIKCEFTEFSSSFPFIHNASSYESYFPSSEDFPHKVGDIIRAEVKRTYIKCESDGENNVTGIKDGIYENHFIHKVNWNTWTKVDSAEVKVDSADVKIDPESETIQAVTEGWGDQVKDNEKKPTTVTFNDERQADRDARKDNSSQSNAKDIIMELWKAGRFPQIKEYTDIIHMGVQINILTDVLKTRNDSEELREIHNNYVDFLENEEINNVMDWGQN